MNELTRFPLHTEPASEVRKWTDIGWTDCGEHPSEPGYVILEWRRGGAICFPLCADSVRLVAESLYPAIPDAETATIARAAADLRHEQNDAFVASETNDAFGKSDGL